MGSPSRCSLQQQRRERNEDNIVSQREDPKTGDICFLLWGGWVVDGWMVDGWIGWMDVLLDGHNGRRKRHIMKAGVLRGPKVQRQNRGNQQVGSLNEAPWGVFRRQIPLRGGFSCPAFGGLPISEHAQIRFSPIKI